MMARLATMGALLAVAALGAGLSGANFSAQTSNAGNTLSTALSFCVSPGTQTAAASKDAYVSEALPDTNFGTVATALVEANVLDLVLVLGDKRVLVEFNLPATPTNCTVTGATLRMYATAAAGGRTIDVYRAASSWTEAGVTWNTKPVTAGSAASAASATGSVSWDVTSQVQAMYSGTNNGFVIRDSDEGSLIQKLQTYQSREGAPDSQDPELQVTFG